MLPKQKLSLETGLDFKVYALKVPCMYVLATILRVHFLCTVEFCQHCVGCNPTQPPAYIPLPGDHQLSPRSEWYWWHWNSR